MLKKNEITIKSRIKRIKRTRKIDEISLDCLPPVQNDEYFFVSYSHKDYKKVYEDIFYLQQFGISIWYDRGMTPGKDWKDTAEQYINKYNCKGMILYVSENSIQSEAIFQEVMFAKECGKDILLINIDYKGQYYSALELMNLLSSKGVNFSSDAISFIEKYLNNDVLYLKYSDVVNKKIDKIHLLKEPVLLKLSLFNSYILGQDDEEDYFVEDDVCYDEDLDESEIPNGVELTFQTLLINDIDVIKVEQKDFKKALEVAVSEQGTLEGPLLAAEILWIGDLTFANCKKMEKVEFLELSNSSIGLYIGQYAFYNCYKLSNIDLSMVSSIGMHSFENCFSLEAIDISKILYVSERAFYNCSKLKKVKFNDDVNVIYACAFSKTAIESVRINSLRIISYGAFSECKNLYEFINYGKSELEIGSHAFSGCKNLSNFVYDGICKSIGDYAFCFCGLLKEFVANDVNEFNIGKRSFYGCNQLESFIFKNGKIKVGSSAFEDCTNLVNFPFENVVSIDSRAFYNCEKLFVPNLTCEFIDDQAFSGCLNIYSLEFNTDKTLTLSSYSLSEMPNLEKVLFNCNVIDIPMGLFRCCNKLREVYLPNTILKISKYAFNYCYSLEKVLYNGTISEWNILMENNNIDYFDDTSEYVVVCSDGILQKNN